MKRHCAICHAKDDLLLIKGANVCQKNNCAIKYYQQIGWLTTARNKKTGRPRLYFFSSEAQRKAHYRIKKRDKTPLTYYFKKKHIKMKKPIN